MHKSSLLRMNWFVENFVKNLGRSDLKILDVGSYNVNGCYKPLFDFGNCLYQGLDMTEGPNVDIVPEYAYNWKEIADETYDAVISGQAFEHAELFWVTFSEMVRVLKKGGVICVIAPRGFQRHRSPVDCYRFDVDAMVALARFARLDILHASTNLVPENANESEWCVDGFEDTMLVAHKPECWQGMADLSRYRFKESAIETIQLPMSGTDAWFATNQRYTKQYNTDFEGFYAKFKDRHPDYCGDNPQLTCNVCGCSFKKFAPVDTDNKFLPKKQECCPVCFSLPGERLALKVFKDEVAPSFKSRFSVVQFIPRLGSQTYLRKMAEKGTIEFVDCNLTDLGGFSAQFTENAGRLSFKDRSFDVIIGADVLNQPCVRDDKKFAEELYRVLSPEGVALLTVPVYSKQLCGRRDDGVSFSIGICGRRYLLETVEHLLAQVGFVVERKDDFSLADREKFGFQCPSEEADFPYMDEYPEEMLFICRKKGM